MRPVTPFPEHPKAGRSLLAFERDLPPWGPSLILLLCAVTNALGASSPLEVTLSLDAGLRAHLHWEPLPHPALYTVESTDSLDQVWKSVPPAGQWPIEGTDFVDPRASFLPAHRFYRVVAETIPEPTRAALISFRQEDSLSPDQVLDWAERIGITGIAGEVGVTLYSVLYETIDAQGRQTVASGGVVIPSETDAPLPLFSFQHDTVLDRENVPSRFRFDSLESLMPIFAASQGFVAAAPDYLGLGDSPGFHPYLIANAAANAVVDLLPIAAEIANAEGFETLGEVYLMGYGEGGFATMAAHRELESDPDSSLEVIASVPMAGPYDLSDLFLSSMLDENLDHPNPFIFPYWVRAYDDVYDLYDDPLEVFTRSVTTRALPRMNGRTDGEAMNQLLPSSHPRSLLQDRFVLSLSAESEHPFQIALQRNNVYDWKPRAPIRMYHCDADLTFTKSHSEKALDAFFANGSNAGELIDPIPSLNHAECDGVSFTSAMIWINRQRN